MSYVPDETVDGPTVNAQHPDVVAATEPRRLIPRDTAEERVAYVNRRAAALAAQE